MRKQELIHLHGLLVEVRRYLDEQEELPSEAFEVYDTNGVAPTSIYYSKGAHQEALFLLLEGLYAAVSNQQPILDESSSLSNQLNPPTQ